MPYEMFKKMFNYNDVMIVKEEEIENDLWKPLEEVAPKLDAVINIYPEQEEHMPKVDYAQKNQAYYRLNQNYWDRDYGLGPLSSTTAAPTVGNAELSIQVAALTKAVKDLLEVVTELKMERYL